MTVVWRNSLMLAHLPGRMSQPSRKGVTSNTCIAVLFSRHEKIEYKFLTSQLRLPQTIQYRHWHLYHSSLSEVPSLLNNNNVVVWLQLHNTWFCYHRKRKREIRSVNSSKFTTLHPFLKNLKDNHKLTPIWETNQTAILKKSQRLSKPIVVVLTIFVSLDDTKKRVQINQLIVSSKKTKTNHGLDSFRKTNYHRHPIHLNDNITDITQQKIRK
jgi:viroplasmin and RNaseH domain-containing protein